MRLEFRLRLVDDRGDVLSDELILSAAKSVDRLEALGLSMAEAKALLHTSQMRIVAAQAQAFAHHMRACPACGKLRGIKDTRVTRFRTLFGKVDVPGPRLRHCGCYRGAAKTFCPLTKLLTGHAAPELLYLEAKWASHLSYDLTAELLGDVLPVAASTNAATIRNDVLAFAGRHDTERSKPILNVADHFPEACDPPPMTAGRIVVGLDGGYVRSWSEKSTHLEVIAGRVDLGSRSSLTGFSGTYAKDPKASLRASMEACGYQDGQDSTIMTDGADNLRTLAKACLPGAEHILDWFHVTMRFTVLGQFAKGLVQHNEEVGKNIADRLERIKWCLWNGDTDEAVYRLDWLSDDLADEGSGYPKLKKFIRLVDECRGYISNNSDAIVNYAERYRYGDPISTAPTESAVNVLIDKRMSKRQQMQWTAKGAHLLLITRSETLNGTLRKAFKKQFPYFPEEAIDEPSAAAA